MTKVMRKEARHTEMRDRAGSGWKRGKERQKDGKGRLEALAPVNQKSLDQDFLLEGARLKVLY